jgi:hypothetical protein
VPVVTFCSRIRRRRAPSRLGRPEEGVAVSSHVPVRPTWTCAGCSSAWPCDTRRAELLAEYDRAPVSLSLFLAACLVDAARDLPYASAGDLYGRFVGWMWQRRSAVPGR